MATGIVSRLFSFSVGQLSTCRRICYESTLKLAAVDFTAGINASLNVGLQSLGTSGLQQIRCRMKDYLRRPSEFKRIRKHGWKTRMSTPGGRMVIMRRLLKGRHILSH